MNLSQNKAIKYLSILLFGIFCLNILFYGLYRGGRWILAQQIAFGDRLSNGISKYCNGIDDLFCTSSAYFPGVGFLSYFYNVLGIENLLVNSQVMIITAMIIGIFYFLLLNKLTLKLYPHISPIAILAISSILYATHFISYMRYYLPAFKPDTALLFIGLLSLFLLEKGKKPSIFSIFCVGALLFIATFLKQSFFIIYFLVYLIIFFHKHLNVKGKILILFAYTAVGLFALKLIFDIENVYYFTVKVMSQHPFHSTQDITNMFASGAMWNAIFILSLVLFLYKQCFKLYGGGGGTKRPSLATNYLFFSLIWFCFSALSAAKVGGNVGNIDVGLIVFLPFAICYLNDFFQKYYNQKTFNYLILAIICIGIVGHSYLAFRYFNKYTQKFHEQKQSIVYLSAKFSNAKACIGSYKYIISRAAGIKVLTDLGTVGHIKDAKNHNITNFENALKSKTYDLVFLRGPYSQYFQDFKNKKVQEIFQNNYELLADDAMPSYLYNDLNKIYIPKKR